MATWKGRGLEKAVSVALFAWAAISLCVLAAEFGGVEPARTARMAVGDSISQRPGSSSPPGCGERRRSLPVGGSFFVGRASVERRCGRAVLQRHFDEGGGGRDRRIGAGVVAQLHQNFVEGGDGALELFANRRDSDRS